LEDWALILEKIDHADIVSEMKEAAKGQKTNVDPALCPP
jgi:hypothetical protein